MSLSSATNTPASDRLLARLIPATPYGPKPAMLPPRSQWFRRSGPVSVSLALVPRMASMLVKKPKPVMLGAPLASTPRNPSVLPRAVNRLVRADE